MAGHKGHKPKASSAEYVIHGTDTTKTSKQKRQTHRAAKSSENEELRTARGIMCRGERDGGTYPIHNACATRVKGDGIVTLRPYLYNYHPEGAVSG